MPKTYTIRFDRDFQSEIDKVAREKNVSVFEFIQRAVQTYAYINNNTSEREGLVIKKDSHNRLLFDTVSLEDITVSLEDITEPLVRLPNRYEAGSAATEGARPAEAAIPGTAAPKSGKVTV